MIRPSIVEAPLTIWLASGGTTLGSIGCRPTSREAPSRRLSHTSSGLPDEVVLVQLHQPVEAGTEGLSDRVGVLSDDEVALFEPHDPLSLEPEGSDAEVAGHRP